MASAAQKVAVENFRHAWPKTSPRPVLVTLNANRWPDPSAYSRYWQMCTNAVAKVVILLPSGELLPNIAVGRPSSSVTYRGEDAGRVVDPMCDRHGVLAAMLRKIHSSFANLPRQGHGCSVRSLVRSVHRPPLEYRSELEWPGVGGGGSAEGQRAWPGYGMPHLLLLRPDGILESSCNPQKSRPIPDVLGLSVHPRGSFLQLFSNISSGKEHGADAGPVWKRRDASPRDCRLARICRGSVASCAAASPLRFLATCSVRKAAGHPAPHVSQSDSICSHGFSGRRQILRPDPFRRVRLPAVRG